MFCCFSFYSVSALNITAAGIYLCIVCISNICRIYNLLDFVENAG
jgi:hypothetical protein